MKKIIIGIIALVIGVVGYQLFPQLHSQTNLKLYWFIPDGVRAEPELFTMFQWAQEGKLPNIKKLMDQGSYGYAYPNFPSHTPTNFATLLTGAYPSVNGVNDGPMHVIGKPLNTVAIAGFRSVAKKVAPIWKTLEDVGLKVALIAIPGSTPPEIQKGVVIRGRWGGWGADFHAINFETKGNLAQRIKQGRGTRLFYFGPQLALYIDPVTPSGWSNVPVSYSNPLEIVLEGYGASVYAYIYDSTNDKVKNYDHVAFSLDKKQIFADITEGQWSNWQQIVLKWKAEDKTVDVASNVKIALIKLGNDGFFRVRFLYNTLNEYIAQPPAASEALQKITGPMVDFADNFPAQLVYYPEDKKIFMDEATMTYQWHQKAISAVTKQFSPNVVIHDIYTPNQMLTGRWWMGYVDPKSTRYNDVSSQEREKLWQEVQEMYKRMDDMVGEILKNADRNTYIVFSSDHGAIPLNKSVNLNNLFAQKGWLKFTIDPKTGEPIIDWNKTKVIYLKMAHVYVNPNGLAGDYKRASGPAYETLRNEVRRTLENLTDSKGNKPVTEVTNWEDVQKHLQLDSDRAGDLVIANTPGFGWNEEMTSDLTIFSDPLITGYKQAIYAKDVPGMWTPFIIAGPNIKKNNFLGNTPFELVDEYPTILQALKVKAPSFVQGKVLPVFQ